MPQGNAGDKQKIGDKGGNQNRVGKDGNKRENWDNRDRDRDRNQMGRMDVGKFGENIKGRGMNNMSGEDSTCVSMCVFSRHNSAIVREKRLVSASVNLADNARAERKIPYDQLRYFAFTEGIICSDRGDDLL